MDNKYRLGEKVKLSQYSAFRSLAPIYRNDVLYAFLGLLNGWGKRWSVFQVREHTGPLGNTMESVDGFIPDRQRYSPTNQRGAASEVFDALIFVEFFDGPEGKWLDIQQLKAQQAEQKSSAVGNLRKIIGRLTVDEEQAKRRATALTLLETRLKKESYHTACTEQSTEEFLALRECIEKYEKDVRGCIETRKHCEKELQELQAGKEFQGRES